MPACALPRASIPRRLHDGRLLRAQGLGPAPCLQHRFHVRQRAHHGRASATRPQFVQDRGLIGLHAAARRFDLKETGFARRVQEQEVRHARAHSQSQHAPHCETRHASVRYVTAKQVRALPSQPVQNFLLQMILFMRSRPRTRARARRAGFAQPLRKPIGKIMQKMPQEESDKRYPQPGERSEQQIIRYHGWLLGWREG